MLAQQVRKLINIKNNAAHLWFPVKPLNHSNKK